jgi:hypothetical protein
LLTVWAKKRRTVASSWWPSFAPVSSSAAVTTETANTSLVTDLLDGLTQGAVCAQRAAEFVEHRILPRQHDPSGSNRLGSHGVSRLETSVRERAQRDRDLMLGRDARLAGAASVSGTIIRVILYSPRHE